MATPLDALLRMMRADVAEIAAEAAAGRLDARGFQVLMNETVEEYHFSAALVSSGKTRLSDLSSATLDRLEGVLDFHEEKLAGFTDEVARNGWQNGYTARSQMYAGGIRDSYALGQADVPYVGAIELPGRPGDGSTPCLTNCKCRLDRVDVEPELGHYDFFWRRTASESCSGCIDRESRWNPLEVRYGEVANG